MTQTWTTANKEAMRILPAAVDHETLQQVQRLLEHKAASWIYTGTAEFALVDITSHPLAILWTEELELELGENFFLALEAITN